VTGGSESAPTGSSDSGRGLASRARQVVIVASGGANIASLQYALQRLDAASTVSADAQEIRAASHVILPGVGAAANAMARLRQHGLDHVIPTLQQPVLGICLGMQLLYEASDEGGVRCLGVIPGAARRFAESPGRPVPHMGWNTLDLRRQSPLLAGFGAGDYAYFVHSYALALSDATIASTQYGEPFSACVQWRNFFGAQFHPERSAAVGARLLQNFLAIH
jgi:glutamine amidotransferase